MEKKINLIVKDKDKNLRIDVFINKKENDISRTRIKNLILNKKLSSSIGGELRPGIVHRIDKNTSGLVVVAKNNSTHENLSSQFNKHGRMIGAPARS